MTACIFCNWKTLSKKQCATTSQKSMTSKSYDFDSRQNSKNFEVFDDCQSSLNFEALKGIIYKGTCF
ncbi:hypothetical protein HYT92_01755 [Candidatus Pacearchaeota archaeon]|nr:hypothetical protein [Candidatus Pacearchaeota archaeon]